MQQKKERATAAVFSATVIFCLLTMPILAAAQRKTDVPPEHAPPVLTEGEKQTVKAFEKRVKEYVSLRESVERKLPGHSTEAKPAEIEAHKKLFMEAVRNARAGANAGDVFTPDIAAYLKNTIKSEFKGTDRKQLRKTVLEADTKGVPLRVNYPYPETKELSQVPPTLLLKLPQMPKQVRYRFVGRHLLLVDRENDLIIDYLTNALP